ncbi:MAG: MBL fold metallo-hydrolase [Actinomycetales bacterium]|nr:MBL fold metallo-hydrolase [Actinomycetales bacterium]
MNATRTSGGRRRQGLVVLTSLAVLGAGTVGIGALTSSRDDEPVSPTAGGTTDAAAVTGAPGTGDRMEVTLLGTGSPVPSATRFGHSTLVQANGLNLVFDAGRGATIRLNQRGVPLGEVDGVFLTHFHSDHINGLSDLWMTGFIPALGGRQGGFHLYGPKGVEHLAEGLMSTYDLDVSVREADGEVDRETTAVVPHEFDGDGIVFEQDGVTVTMFEVEHDANGAIKPAVGYRVDYGESSVLISGDTRPTGNVIKYGTDVDLLLHEVADFPDPTLPVLQTVYSHHTNPQQAGEIFAQTKPAMAAYTHIVRGAPPQIPNVPLTTIVERTRESYDGPLTVGEDLMTFLIDDTTISVVPHYAENE